jgi:hypothetical protein
MSDTATGSGNTLPQEIIPPGTPSPGEVVENRRANFNRLVRQARLSNLLLESLTYKIHPEAIGGVNKALLTRSIAPKTTVMSSGVTDGHCVANIVWEVTFRFKRRTVMKCAASYIISYEGIRDCSEETITIFVEHVGKVATYAYFRSLYAQLDWASMSGSEPLPILQLHPKL